VDDGITPLLLKPALETAGVDDLSKLTWGTVMKRKKEEPVAPTAPQYTLQEKLLMEIRDAVTKE